MNDKRWRAERELIAARVTKLDPGICPQVVAEVLENTGPYALSVLSRSLRDDPRALLAGAPPAVGSLVRSLRAKGSSLPEPSCRRCGRTGPELVWTDSGGVCARCRRRETASACANCGVTKPVYGRGETGEPLCSVCAPRPKRRCSRCGRLRAIARRAHDGDGELCDSCFKGPVATCRECGRPRPCQFVSIGQPICASCTPRVTRRCSHCGQDRPVCARWPEGPVCEACYRAAHMRRGICGTCSQLRRLVFPPGPGATHCASCAGVTGLVVCRRCGLDDRMYADGQCVRCALADKARDLIGEPGGTFEPLYEAIVAAPKPYSMHNWIGSSGPAAILKQLVSSELALSHEALDNHPRRRSAAYLRHLLVSSGLLPWRDNALVELEAWVTRRLEEVDDPHDRSVLRSYATWRVLRRARQRSERDRRPRTPTRHAKTCLSTAASFLEFLRKRQVPLALLSQRDLDDWIVAGPPGAFQVSDFLDWAATQKMSETFSLPSMPRRYGPSTDNEARFETARLLLHDDSLELSDRVAGLLVLLYGQQLTRIANLRRDQVTFGADGSTRLGLGTTSIELPPPFDELVRRLLSEHRRHTAFSAPASTQPWLFPGLHAGRPFNASQIGARLRRLGIEPQAARRGALLHLAASMPAAVIARALGLTPVTAVRWLGWPGETGTTTPRNSSTPVIANHDE